MGKIIQLGVEISDQVHHHNRADHWQSFKFTSSYIKGKQSKLSIDPCSIKACMGKT